MSCPGFLLCRDDNICVHPNDLWSGRIKCPLSIYDKALQDVGACPPWCGCLGNAIKCTSAIHLKLPKLQATLRILIISNTPFTLDDITWKADLITLLHLKVSFCNVSAIQNKHFTPLRFLQTLRLRNNLISFLPSGVFQTLSNIRELDLGHKLLSHLHSEIFIGANKLYLLKLDSNKLSFVAPRTFDELEILAILDLSNNYLSNMGDNFLIISNHL